MYIFLAVITMTACRESEMSKAYQKIKDSKLTGQELFAKVSDFELTHPGHFQSKVDLAVYYLLTGNYTSGLQYLKRAEAVLPAASKKDATPESKAAFYAAYASAYLAAGNTEDAWNYISKARSIKKYGNTYGYLAARILLTRGKKSEALETMDKTYAAVPGNITSDDIRTYMYLLADTGRYDDCSRLTDLFFEKGKYFPDLGLFASTVYEKTGQLKKSVYSAFLDYEYESCFGRADDRHFLENLATVEKTITGKTGYQEGIKALRCVRSLYNDSPFPDDDTDFFVYQYIRAKKKLRTAPLSANELTDYMKLEKYFSEFPVYYWNVWLSAIKDPAASRTDWIPVLERVIISAPKSVYAPQARKAIGQQCGLTAEQSEQLLMPPEIREALLAYGDDSKEEHLEPVYSLLSLPDCTYVYNAIGQVQQNRQILHLDPVLSKRLAASTGRLKDRLFFILK